jgi:preprotein translocase subunit YajC
MADLTTMLLAQAGTEADPLLSFMIPTMLMMGVLYFMMLGPMRKQKKKLEQLQQELKTGDKIIINPGIFGTVVGLEGDALQVRIADQTKIKVLRSAVAGLQGLPETERK